MKGDGRKYPNAGCNGITVNAKRETASLATTAPVPAAIHPRNGYSLLKGTNTAHHRGMLAGGMQRTRRSKSLACVDHSTRSLNAIPSANAELFQQNHNFNARSLENSPQNPQTKATMPRKHHGKLCAQSLLLTAQSFTRMSALHRFRLRPLWLTSCLPPQVFANSVRCTPRKSCATVVAARSSATSVPLWRINLVGPRLGTS